MRPDAQLRIDAHSAAQAWLRTLAMKTTARLSRSAVFWLRIASVAVPLAIILWRPLFGGLPFSGVVATTLTAVVIVSFLAAFFWLCGRLAKESPVPSVRLLARMFRWFLLFMLGGLIFAFVLPLSLWLFVPGFRSP
jgi:hypothetical protein